MLFCIFKFNIKTNKMNNIKDIIIGIFAVIGFAAIVTGFTNETSDPQYPESHVWELVISNGENPRPHAINKVTGEVRIFARSSVGVTTSGLRYYTAEKRDYGVWKDEKKK